MWTYGETCPGLAGRWRIGLLARVWGNEADLAFMGLLSPCRRS